MAKTTTRRRPTRAGTRGLKRVAALDIGCSKVTCFIARPLAEDHTRFEFLGGGHQQSRGFEGGIITDMEGLERSIRLAVEDAERQAGERIDSVVVGLTGPQLTCRLVSAKADISGRPVTAKDVRRLQSQAIEKGQSKAMRILTAHPVAYRLDEQDGIRDPRGMYGDVLEVSVSLVLAPVSLIKNIGECVGRAHLGVERCLPGAIATAMGVLAEDERENGAISIDLGAGVTTACVFVNGAPAWLSYVPIGGGHVTGDLAQGLGTSFAAAERLKTLQGSIDPKGPGYAERIECPRLGEDGRLQAGRVARGELAHIIRPRMEELLEFLSEQFSRSPARNLAAHRVVLTGGASQLRGLRDLASDYLAMPVRLGKPAAGESLGEGYAGPGFSTAAGLLTYHLIEASDISLTSGVADAQPESQNMPQGLKKVLHWLRENF